MTSEAVDVVDDPGVASPELVELVAKREQELKKTPAVAATNTNGTANANAGTTDVGQAEEVEAGGKKAAEDPAKGKSEEVKKALDVEWAKSDTLKHRISTLHEAGHLDDELIDLIRTGVERKSHLRAANDKFEAAADKVKAAHAERDTYKERAERYDRLMADPKFHAALNATEGDTEDESLLSPEEKRLKRLEKDLAEMKAEKQGKAESEKSRADRVKEIEGWAEDHRSSLGDTVSLEDYKGAVETALKEMLEEDIAPLEVLTQRGLVRRVNKVLERQRDEKEVQGLRESVEGSKRDAVRSARASSPAGVRTEVGKTYPSTPEGQRARRAAETLAKYPLRPE